MISIETTRFVGRNSAGQVKGPFASPISRACSAAPVSVCGISEHFYGTKPMEDLCFISMLVANDRGVSSRRKDAAAAPGVSGRFSSSVMIR